MSDLCPCGLGEPYEICCGRFHRGLATGDRPPTAERLMRSRYSAFALDQPAYLLATWHPDTRPRQITLEPAQVWTRLVILGTTDGGFLDSEGTVEFVAQYRRTDGMPPRGRQHETSRFLRIDGFWLYHSALR